MELRGLYPIVDVSTLERRGLPVLVFAERVLAARPPLVQLRAKDSNARDTLALLRALAPLCARSGALLFANDRPDLALLAEAPGVHVGQHDLPLAEVRRFAPALKVGVSTHTLAELDEALAGRPDYVAFGPVFATPSKVAHEPPVGIDGLALAHERARRAGVPLVAIGGLELERASQVAAHCEAAAVIGALLPEQGGLEGVTERAVALSAAL
ncbi:MAG TPA: thiamine phosphate synthase, partial [Polyangiaceae bacterium]|nr:thiamine phosphate synthase [Polyangiaceae bacterium]